MYCVFLGRYEQVLILKRTSVAVQSRIPPKSTLANSVLTLPIEHGEALLIGALGDANAATSIGNNFSRDVWIKSPFHEYFTVCILNPSLRS